MGGDGNRIETGDTGLVTIVGKPDFRRKIISDSVTESNLTLILEQLQSLIERGEKLREELVQTLIVYVAPFTTSKDIDTSTIEKHIVRHQPGKIPVASPKNPSSNLDEATKKLYKATRELVPWRGLYNNYVVHWYSPQNEEIASLLTSINGTKINQVDYDRVGVYRIRDMLKWKDVQKSDFVGERAWKPLLVPLIIDHFYGVRLDFKEPISKVELEATLGVAGGLNHFNQDGRSYLTVSPGPITSTLVDNINQLKSDAKRSHVVRISYCYGNTIKAVPVSSCTLYHINTLHEAGPEGRNTKVK